MRNRHGRLARVTDLTPAVIQAWMDDMAGADLALSTMRVRQSTLSSFCAWLVKRDVLASNPVAKLERPPHPSRAAHAGPGHRDHGRIDTTQVYANIRPPQLKRAVAFYEESAARLLTT